ncbi:acyltransferase [Azonexus sp. IMCC34842]|uniref:acyltransferase n=1 Tax=Azonexus sp. IMCC34842 TaxID=3420950 RepID=UPI003D0F11B7
MDNRICALRVLACFMVILLHLSAVIYGTVNERWWSGNFYDSLSRSSVPLFLMIAGATLLPKKENIKVFFGKRLVRIIPPLVLWSMLYLFWLDYNGVATGNWVAAMLKGPTMYHLWYFYALVGIYLFVPVIRKFYNNSSRSEHVWFIGVWFVVASVIPTLNNLIFNLHCEGYIGFDTFSSTYHLSYFSGYLGYLVLGAYIADGKYNSIFGTVVFLLASAITAAGSYILSAHFSQPCEFFFVYLSPFVVAAGYGLFIAFMGMDRKAPSKVLSVLADCTLGIYGLHVLVIELFRMQGISVGIGNPWVTIPLVTVGVFVTCFCVIFVLRLVKPFRYVF